MQVPLGVSDWRQLMKTVFRHVLHLNLDDGDDEEAQVSTDSLVHMFGHRESTTGQRYYGLEHSRLGQDFNEVAFANWLWSAIRLHRLQRSFLSLLLLWMNIKVTGIGISG